MSSRHFVVLADVRYEESENGDACELYEKQWIKTVDSADLQVNRRVQESQK